MNDVAEKIRNPVPPTATDLKILAYMDSGNYIDDERGRQLFNSFGLRDSIFRLRKAGHIILDRWVYYNTKSGIPKKYKQWHTKELEIIPAGKKTENELPKELKNSDANKGNAAKINSNGFRQGNILFLD